MFEGITEREGYTFNIKSSFEGIILQVNHHRNSFNLSHIFASKRISHFALEKAPPPACNIKM
jgi:hypothetical protein